MMSICRPPSRLSCAGALTAGVVGLYALVVAVLRPLRTVLQRGVDRVMYGKDGQWLFWF